MNVLQSTYDELKAERDALAIKAARYDWLRISADISWNGWVTHSMLAATDAERAELDSAIDSAMLAAAPAASGGESLRDWSLRMAGKEEGRTITAGSAIGIPDVPASQPPAGASVSEWARAILAGEVARDYPKMARALVAGKSMESYVLVPHCLRALEQALTQQRGECVYLIRSEFGGWTEQSKAAHEWWDGRETSPERRILYTTPQPGAERQPNVVRIPKEKRWVEGDSEFLKWHADGYNSALSDVMSVNQGVSRLEPAEQPGAEALRELVQRWREVAKSTFSRRTAEMYTYFADELESLLARGG